MGDHSEERMKQRRRLRCPGSFITAILFTVLFTFIFTIKIETGHLGGTIVSNTATFGMFLTWAWWRLCCKITAYEERQLGLERDRIRRDLHCRSSQ